MHLSVEASLKKLRTSYIDILYLHWWDFDISVEEVMNGLHILVQQGKVLYLVTHIKRPCHIIQLLKSIVSGYLRYTCLDCVQGKPIRSRLWENPFRDLPRHVEYFGALIRARHNSHGPG